MPLQLPQPFTLKVGETSPALEVQLKRGATYVDLTNDNGGVSVRTASSVSFSLWGPNSSTPLINDAACTMYVAGSGLVRYVWQTADVATKGTYRGDFRVTWSDGTFEMFPSLDDETTHGYITVVIGEREP